MTTEPAIERLRALVRIPTVSRNEPSRVDWPQFERFRAALAEAFPLVHAKLPRESVAEHSLLFRWPGTGVGAPTVLMAHQDVVPADEPGWTHPSFGAELVGSGEEARIWGRGTLDDKGALVAILEAVESRLAGGFAPAADIYLSFGHDEETAGSGASSAADLLLSRGVRPGLVLDEGGAVVEGVFPGVPGQIAVVGVSEKGAAGIELVVEKKGGHASTPARDGATARLARAITRLEERPARPTMSEPTLEMVMTFGSRARGPFGVMLRRARFFRPILTRVFARLGPETSAMVRTTRAVTRLTGSAGDNVIAERATAMVNVRIAVGSTVEEAARDIRKAVDDPSVQVNVVYGADPAPVSPAHGAGWETLSAAIGDVFPGALVAPYVMLQSSDAQHFARISENVYRFLPFDLSAEERGTLHAKDESIRVSTYLRAIAFYDRLIGAL
jgi:carboxypeptidase PM20D1